jgi:hypothetical protein
MLWVCCLGCSLVYASMSIVKWGICIIDASFVIHGSRIHLSSRSLHIDWNMVNPFYDILMIVLWLLGILCLSGLASALQAGKINAVQDTCFIVTYMHLFYGYLMQFIAMRNIQTLLNSYNCSGRCTCYCHSMILKYSHHLLKWLFTLFMSFIVVYKLFRYQKIMLVDRKTVSFYPVTSFNPLNWLFLVDCRVALKNEQKFYKLLISTKNQIFLSTPSPFLAWGIVLSLP